MFDHHDPSTDGDLFQVLASQRRRLLLRSLINHGGTADLRELSREIVAHETNAPPTAVDNDDVTLVYGSLCLEHIPVLEEHGIIAFDDGHVVYEGDRTDEIIALLQEPGESQRPRALYYLGIAVLLWGIVLLRVFHVVPVPDSLMWVFTIAAAAGLLGLAMARYYGIRPRRFGDSPLDPP